MLNFGISIVGILTACVLFTACNRATNNEQFEFSQMIGRWTSVDSVSSQTEEWTCMNDSTYYGLGYVIEEGDTTFFESLEIVFENGNWVYKARVGQGVDSETVSFLLNRQSGSLVEFANENHDFPKRIGYELLSNREMQAYIEGPRDGQNIRIIFNFVRNEK
ncbi:MAG: DUF6265 family protein [Flavobacteriales bacterium]